MSNVVSVDVTISLKMVRTAFCPLSTFNKIHNNKDVIPCTLVDIHTYMHFSTIYQHNQPVLFRSLGRNQIKLHTYTKKTNMEGTLSTTRSQTMSSPQDMNLTIHLHLPNFPAASSSSSSSSLWPSAPTTSLEDTQNIPRGGYRTTDKDSTPFPYTSPHKQHLEDDQRSQTVIDDDDNTSHSSSASHSDLFLDVALLFLVAISLTMLFLWLKQSHTHRTQNNINKNNHNNNQNNGWKKPPS